MKNKDLIAMLLNTVKNLNKISPEAEAKIVELTVLNQDGSGKPTYEYRKVSPLKNIKAETCSDLDPETGTFAEFASLTLF